MLLFFFFFYILSCSYCLNIDNKRLDLSRYIGVPLLLGGEGVEDVQTVSWHSQHPMCRISNAKSLKNAVLELAYTSGEFPPLICEVSCTVTLINGTTTTLFQSFDTTTKCISHIGPWCHQEGDDTDGYPWPTFSFALHSTESANFMFDDPVLCMSQVRWAPGGTIDCEKIDLEFAAEPNICWPWLRHRGTFRLTGNSRRITWTIEENRSLDFVPCFAEHIQRGSQLEREGVDLVQLPCLSEYYGRWKEYGTKN